MKESDQPPPEIKEFKREDFPELTACKVLPSDNQAWTEVETTDFQGNDAVVEVPAAAVIFMNIGGVIPKVAREQSPGPITKQLMDDVGYGLLACRIVNRAEDRGLVQIEIPTKSGVNRLVISEDKLARKV